MDQPKPLSAREKLEKILGITWEVLPVARTLRGFRDPTKPRRNRVAVIEPNGKRVEVQRYKSHSGAYRCESCHPDNECEHILKAKEYWAEQKKAGKAVGTTLPARGLK